MDIANRQPPIEYKEDGDSEEEHEPEPEEEVDLLVDDVLQEQESDLSSKTKQEEKNTWVRTHRPL